MDESQEGAKKPESRVYTLEADFVRFSKQRAREIKKQSEATGLPLNRIQQVLSRWIPQVLGVYGDAFFVYSSKEKYGWLVITKLLELFIHPKGFRSVLIHEIAHANEPSNQQNLDLYASEENRLLALGYSEHVTDQGLRSQKFLNGYHKALTKEYGRGEIDYERFRDETFAILVELRYMNPKKLLQVQEAQERALAKKGQEHTFVPLMTPEGGAEPEGVDEILLLLTPDHIKTLGDLNKLTENYREGKV